jgi:hypothetical protein
MSLASIKTLVAAAVAAQEAGDLATAITKLTSAQLLFAAVPNSRSGADGLDFDRASIDRMISTLRQRQTNAEISSTGIRTMKTRYVRPRSSECD